MHIKIKNATKAYQKPGFTYPETIQDEIAYSETKQACRKSCRLVILQYRVNRWPAPLSEPLPADRGRMWTSCRSGCPRPFR